mmetsp:Transcript_23877/g.75077  ORF Transcript_23877/g.75077 Transcript_23877/m.75077 type:complete len:133 (+) Transcript_23877:1390-1788(+)
MRIDASGLMPWATQIDACRPVQKKEQLLLRSGIGSSRKVGRLRSQKRNPQGAMLRCLFRSRAAASSKQPTARSSGATAKRQQSGSNATELHRDVAQRVQAPMHGLAVVQAGFIDRATCTEAQQPKAVAAGSH